MDYLNRYFLTIFLLFACTFCQVDAANDGGRNSNASPEAVESLPAWLGDGFSTSLTDHFFVAHDGGPSEANELAGQLEYAFGYFRLFFEQSGFTLPEPPKKLSWIGFSDTDHFSRYALRADRMDLSQLSGYYSAKTNRVAIVGTATRRSEAAKPVRPVEAMDTDGEIAAMAGDENPNKFVKIAHELAHQLAFNTGLQKRGVMYPLWTSEGLATQYETRLSYCRDANQARSDRLLEMRDSGRLIPLRAFAAATRLPADQEICEDLYAQAWGFFGFLLKTRPRQLRSYLDALCHIEPGYRPPAVLRKEFTDHFGSTDELGKEWLQYLFRQ